MLNGIPDVVRQSDLADRAILYELTPPTTRLSEREFWRRFGQERPALFAALLDLLAGALAQLPNARVPETHDVRMADFAHFGEAVCLALGKQPGEFTRAFHENRTAHARDIAEGDRIYETLVKLLDAHGGTWHGSMDELRKAIESIDLTVRGKGWPTSGKGMEAYLKRLKPALKATGVTYERQKRSAGKTVYEVRMVAS